MTALASAQDAVERRTTARGRALMTTAALLTTFSLVTAERIVGSATRGTFGIDARIYRSAAEAALAGRDPWAVGVDGLTFAGPPPTLVAYIPAALLPEGIALLLYAAISIAAAVAVLRTLHLPIWWLLFPPISDSLLVLNPDIVVIALLVATPRFAALSVPLKPYAAVPLLLTERWKPLAIGLGLCLLSVPWWSAFLANREAIASALASQSFGGMSAWATWLMVPTGLALVVLFRRGAEWLAVPALWPYTQLHYSALALPIAAKNVVVAFLLCFSVAFLPPIATIVYAVWVVVARRLAIYRANALATVSA